MRIAPVLIAIFAVASLVGGALSARAQAPAPTVVTAQILDYEKGYLFFTSGDGFHVSPTAQIVDFKTQAATTAVPAVREFARVTFDPNGVVTKIELSNARLAAEGDLSQVHRFAVALSTPAPNPDLAPAKGSALAGSCNDVTPGKRVSVRFTVQVPPMTGLADQIYMTTDQAAWNPQAYKFDRIDALHYQSTLSLLSGTVFQYLFDRGSSESLERGQNGIEAKPEQFCVGSADVQSHTHIVYHWGDESGGSSTLPVPQALPTPYNPAPFPNLPTPGPFKTP
ncbi:MAG TPA: hypothetical protein VIG32_01405 [Candidatus Baltobacteraceae bacterium]